MLYTQKLINRNKFFNFVINRKIFIPKREIGRFKLLYQKLGDLPPNRETWKLFAASPLHVLESRFCLLSGIGLHTWRRASSGSDVSGYTLFTEIESLRIQDIWACHRLT